MTVDLAGVRLVSWDVDGTLFPASALKRQVLREALGEARRRGPWAALRWLRDLTAQLRSIEAARGDGRVAEDLLGSEWYARFQQDVERAVARLSPSRRAVELIARIAAAGIPQVVLSDHPARVKVERLGLSSSFAACYACAELGFWKPSPEPFREVERRHGVPAEAHLHIGDRDDSDGEAARRAGCRFLLFRA